MKGLAFPPGVYDYMEKSREWILKNCFAQQLPGQQSDPLSALTEALYDDPRGAPAFIQGNAATYSPMEVSFQGAGDEEPAGPVLVVQVNGQRYVIEDLGTELPSIEEASEWVHRVPSHDLGRYVPYGDDFSEEFWEGRTGALYHGTSRESAVEIMERGLLPTGGARAMSNRGIGEAIFASPDIETPLQLYDVVIEIDVARMRADGYLPRVDRETPFEESDMRDALAAMIGLQDFHSGHEYESSEGLMRDTVIFYEPIPPRYLEVVHGEDVEASAARRWIRSQGLSAVS